MPQSSLRGNESRASLGDFQTPAEFTDSICAYLAKEGYNPVILLEPTVGAGNFVFSALEYFPRLNYVYAVDSQEQYGQEFHDRWVKFVMNMSSDVELEFYLDNIFTHNFSMRFLKSISDPDSSLLILGNPPWVTNAGLSRLGSDNVPEKSNLKKVKGIEALTGKGNFDISESILLHVLHALSPAKARVAMLLKMPVVRNFVRDSVGQNLSLSGMRALSFDAKLEFGIVASAALFLATVGEDQESRCISMAFDNDQDSLQREFGYVGTQFVSDVATYGELKHLDGSSPFTWRQGLKHDAAKVMVLDLTSNSMFINGLGEQVKLEPDLLFPFVKGSALARTRVLQDSTKRVIVTQTKLGEDTTAIADTCPLLWDYLVSHGEILDARKSSMYLGKPRFSIFGVGPYAFLPYKVGIASFYKVPAFTLVLPDHGKPTMLDDTSYFLGFEELMPAFFAWVALNLPQVQVFLQAIAFPDAKRPYTKDILMRLDLDQLLSDVPYAIISEFYESSLKDVLDLHFTEGEWDHFRGTLESPTRCLKVKNQN